MQRRKALEQQICFMEERIARLERDIAKLDNEIKERKDELRRSDTHTSLAVITLLSQQRLDMQKELMERKAERDKLQQELN